MTNVDTPDHQVGIVSAQKLLATVPDTDTSVTVTVPPNTETIVVLAPGSLNPADFTCTGGTSGLNYPPTPYGPSTTGADTTAIVFDVSSAVDSQATITYGFAASFVWYVYSDAAAHVSISPYLARVQAQNGGTIPVDALEVGGTDGTDLRAIRTDTNGQQFTVPAPPGTASGDHPPVELALRSGGVTASGNALAAPGAGKRYRIFSVQLATIAGTLTGYLTDGNGGLSLIYAADAGGARMTFGPSGLTLGTDNPLYFLAGGGAGTMQWIATYTTETV